MHKDHPQVTRPIKSRVVKAKKFFRFSVRKHFLPRDTKLKFELLESAPYWIDIDAKTGILSGMPPRNAHEKQFLITVKATNAHGEITQSFFLKVMETDIVEAYAQKLINILSLRKRLHRIPDDIPHMHDLLEYLFEFLMESEEKDRILEKIKDKAEELELEISDEVKYEDFKKVIEEANPGVEKQISEQLESEHVLTVAELNNQEFRHLYRQGSAQLGSHAIPIWNYLAFADYHRWSEVKNVLDAAADKVIEIKHEAKEFIQEKKEVIEDIKKHTPKPGPKVGR